MPSIVPAPLSYKAAVGSFQIQEKTAIVAAGDARPVGDRLREFLRPATGYDLRVDYHPHTQAITLKLDDQEKGLGDEGYKLHSGPDGVIITAFRPAGLFYGAQTLRQLLPVEVFESKAHLGVPWVVPGCEIEDKPRFAWRGMHLDVSRHFYGPKFIKQFIDWLAVHKMNTFHWHLTDDGGWRLEIKKYPKLTEVGAWREEQGVKWSYNGLKFPGKGSGKKLYGGFYTQDEVRDIVKYAAARYINIVPEIEMPGHSTETVASYPILSCSPGADVLANYLKGSGADYPMMLCAGKASTLEFCENVLTEVLDLFPSKFIHIGGDEVPKDLWAQCPDCKARMAREGLKNVEELQSAFVHDIDKWLADHGRRLVGWDEILEGGLAPGATVMSWRGIDGGIAAAKANHDVVMSPTSHCYFDSPNTVTTMEHVYSYDPIPGELSETQGQHVLGAQANIWTEWLATEGEVEAMMFPRAAALAEDVWTKFERKDWDDFERRMKTHYQRLDRLGIAYYVEAPTPKSELVLLGNSSPVEFEAPAVPGVVIRYTVDGSEPTVKSPEYVGPIRLNRPGVVKAATFRGSGTKSGTVTVPVVSLKADDTAGKINGVNRHVRMGSFSTCPDPKTFDATAKNVVSVGLDELATQENYALLFDGFIRIPSDGEYTFYLGSDDGSRLWLDGNLAIDNDGLHAYGEKRLRVRLPKGDYPFKLVMFQGGGAAGLRLFVEGPGMVKQLIPATMLWSKG